MKNIVIIAIIMMMLVTLTASIFDPQSRDTCSLMIAVFMAALFIVCAIYAQGEEIVKAIEKQKYDNRN